MNWNNEIVGLWPTPFLRHQIADESVLNRVAQIDADQDSDSDDVFASDDTAIQSLRSMIDGAVEAYFKQLEVKPAPGWRLRGRLDRLAFGESRGLTNTPGALLSGMIYIQAPKDIEPLHLRKDVHPGNVTFYDPRPGFNMLAIKGDPYREQVSMVEPQRGLFLMWPAFVNYCRHPNLSRTPQLCICFDVFPDEGAAEDSPVARRWDGEVHELWHTGLIKRRLPDYEERNRELIEIIDKLEGENPNLTTDFDAKYFLHHKHPAVEWLVSHINQSVSAYIKQIGIQYPISWDMAAWPNINRFGDYHNPHNHPWCYLSGTYYIRIPEAEMDEERKDALKPACISYYDPRAGMHSYRYPADSRAGPAFTIKPVPGALLLWPSSLYHFIHPNLSQQKRYSFSFNIHLKWQDHYL